VLVVAMAARRAALLVIFLLLHQAVSSLAGYGPRSVRTGFQIPTLYRGVLLFVFLEFTLQSARAFVSSLLASDQSVGENRILLKGFRSMTKDFHDVLLKITFFHSWVLRVSAFLISSPVIFLRFNC
jgi:hypothetical protein